MNTYELLKTVENAQILENELSLSYMDTMEFEDDNLVLSVDETVFLDENFDFGAYIEKVYVSETDFDLVGYIQSEKRLYSLQDEKAEYLEVPFEITLTDLIGDVYKYNTQFRFLQFSREKFIDYMKELIEENFKEYFLEY